MEGSVSGIGLGQVIVPTKFEAFCSIISYIWQNLLVLFVCLLAVSKIGHGAVSGAF